MPLREVMLSRWRDPATGRFTSRGAGTPESYEALQDTETGQVITMQRGGFTSRTVVKNINQADLDRSHGKIVEAFTRTNITQPKSWQGAKRISVTIRGMDSDGKEHRYKMQIDTRGQEKKLDRLMMSRVIRRLQEHGFRPKYPLSVVNWQAKGRRAKKSHAASRRQLDRLSVSIRIDK